MEEQFKAETEGLVRSWMQHEAHALRDYLIQGVEDPRINAQSILTRHFLIGRLFPGQFASLMAEELRFGAVLNWVLGLFEQVDVNALSGELLSALLEGAGEVEGLTIPPFVLTAFDALPGEVDAAVVPNYLIDFLSARSPESEAALSESVLSTFQHLWRGLFDPLAAPRLSVLEPACGSANDYRFLDAFGLARLLGYTGFDLCAKNIENARAMFPAAAFKVDNVIEIDEPDRAFEYCFVHDLFEHLSIEAMERAIGEVCRVTRRGLCAGFFSMHEGDEHLVNPVRDYHWNTLSRAGTRAIFERHASSVEVVHIGGLLASRFDGPAVYNPGAYVFFVTI